MNLEKRKITGREKDETSVRLLGQLREKLCSDDISTARRAGFNLSWMQEDGLDILKEVLFGGSPRSTKTAAAYGLRSMHGRMKKMALEVLQQGLEHTNTRDVCSKALTLLKDKGRGKLVSRGTARADRFKIRGISGNSRERGKMHKIGRRRISSSR